MPKNSLEMQIFDDNWEKIREEGLKMVDQGLIKASDTYNDVGFNSFFRTGWKRFYLKWYDTAHPSAEQLCPFTVGLLKQVPNVKAAMFTHLPPGARWYATATRMRVRSAITWVCRHRMMIAALSRWMGNVIAGVTARVCSLMNPSSTTLKTRRIKTV